MANFPLRGEKCPWSEELPAYVSEFLEKAKEELVEAYEENLRKR
ncbi:hypothetical protein [Desulfosporosinus youngiae]|nr:hypothetical protein [Desulfosporosinus youngiae]